MEALSGENLPGWVAAYFEIAHLKQLYRQGWLRRGIPRERCESVAEHTFGTALLAWWLAQAYFPDLDSVRVLRLALLHDLGEVYAGDLIPEEGVPPAEKHPRELESVQKIFAKLPEGKLYLQLWLEFEEGSTPEARFVHQVDRLEMALQASLYEVQGYSRMQEFFDTAGADLQGTPLDELFLAVLKSRRSDDQG